MPRTHIFNGNFAQWGVNSMSKQKRVWLGFLISTGCALLLYLPFRSIQWDLNGITEAQAVETGGTELVSPNHMLYRPLGSVILGLSRWVGYAGHSSEILQYLTLVMASLGIGLVWVWVHNLNENTVVASFASAFLATTWAYWVFSTDIYYITPAAMLVVGALTVLSQKAAVTRTSAVNIAIMAAGAILFWQANIFLVPILALGLLLQPTSSRKQTLTAVSMFLTLAVGIVGLVYLVTGVLALHLNSMNQGLNWLMSHSSEGRIPLWGKWGFDRLQPAAVSALSSFVPVWEGLGLRNILRGSFDPARLLAPISLLALVLLGIVTGLGAVIVILRAGKTARYNLTWLGLAYCVYVPFIVWWDPYEPKWFVIPNLFLVTFLAQVWAAWPARRRLYVPLAAIVFLIAAANFVYTVWPRHSDPNANLQIARCFVANTTAQDVIVTTDWNWYGYATYFFHYSGSNLSLVGEAGEKSHIRQLIQNSLTEANRKGGHVLMQDLKSYSPDQLSFVELLSGLTPEDVGAFKWLPAFSCNGVDFQELASAQTQ